MNFRAGGPAFNRLTEAAVHRPAAVRQRFSHGTCRPACDVEARAIAPRLLSLSPQWALPGVRFRHTWEGIANVDPFRWMARRDVQDQIAVAQRELGGRHVRAVGMFDDELRIFCPSPASFMGYESKEPRTNWQTVDYMIDSLLDRGVNTMFTTSFIPSALTSGPATVFTTRVRTSPPDD